MSHDPNPDSNPFAAPKPVAADQVAANPARNRAKLDLRLAVLILMIPAIYNYWRFDLQALQSENGALSPAFVMFARTINIGGLVAASLIVWFFGLWILEQVTALIHRVLGCRSQREEWKVALYEVLWSAVYFAMAGAVLWFTWTIGFYRMNWDFYAVSFPVGILAHILAAGFYLPLFYRWYRIERDGSR